VKLSIFDGDLLTDSHFLELKFQDQKSLQNF